MALVMVIFNLKDGVTSDEYETWAKSTDIPTVRGLASISGFDVMKSTGLLMGEGEPPYQYFELIDIADMDAFGAEVGTEKMQAVAAEFQALADNPIFINIDKLG